VSVQDSEPRWHVNLLRKAAAWFCWQGHPIFLKPCPKNFGDTERRSSQFRDPDQIAAAFQRVREGFGSVDLLVNNASASGPFGRPFVEIAPESFARGWRVGVLGSFLCSQAVVPDMLNKNAGCILFTGATSSVRGGAITFSSAKFAVRGLAQAMARELWPQGIHVAHIIVDGVIRESEVELGAEEQSAEPVMNPAAIAEAYWGLVKQDRSAWSLELDLRPHREKFFE
jgi:NAD(P)-dependent dehydrogenase (short-subunit alcohol dehydrogenase family)